MTWGEKYKRFAMTLLFVAFAAMLVLISFWDVLLNDTAEEPRGETDLGSLSIEMAPYSLTLSNGFVFWIDGDFITIPADIQIHVAGRDPVSYSGPVTLTLTAVNRAPNSGPKP